MILIYWIYQTGAPLIYEEPLEALLEALIDFPLASWGGYKLNGTTQRAFLRERALIDLQTQRTQAVELGDRQRRWQGLVTLGKYGERPGVILQGEATEAELPALESWLEERIGDPGVVRISGVAVEARPALPSPLPVIETPAAWDWIGPELLRELGALPAAPPPGTLERREGGVLLRVPEPRWSGEARGALEAMVGWWTA